jgi:hypothetical protein
VQEPPPITITDPGRPDGPADVLGSGSERPPFRLPRRLVAAVLAAVVVAVGTVVGLDRWHQHQADVRRKAAAFAVADALHARITLADSGVYSQLPVELIDAGLPTAQPLPDTGVLVVPLVVTDDPEGFTEIRDIQVLGTGVTTSFDPTWLASRTPGGTASVDVPVTFPCSEVAAGHYPAVMKAVVLLVPPSGRQHRVTLPVTSTPEQSLEACQLPDPKAVPETSVEEQHGRLLLMVTSIPRLRVQMQVLSVTSPGFALQVVGGPPGRPAGQVEPNTATLFDVLLRVTDCAAARGGAGVVTVSLRQGSRRWTLVVPDSPANEFRRPGSTLLHKAVERACP